MNQKVLLFLVKVVLAVVVAYALNLYVNRTVATQTQSDVATAMKQLDQSTDRNKVENQLTQNRQEKNNLPMVFWGLYVLVVLVAFIPEMKYIFGGGERSMSKKNVLLLAALSLGCLSGCMRAFEPVDLQAIAPNEEAFLLPYKGSVEQQASSHTEEYLRKNLVYTQQVQIPQQWVPTGRMNDSGSWKPAAILVKVDKSPVTREWTADSNSGTSNRNEAVWVMTSDQVEFSTGWTCTARVATRDDAVKFLYNYPNGSLEKVMDTEIRAKLQAIFGLEVTDLPMEALRKEATPHITKTAKTITEFFAQRGITITNLGITGGFVYKDDTIRKMMVDVFNAEQQKAITIAANQRKAEENRQDQLNAAAATIRQQEENKRRQFESEAKAKAILTVAEAEAKGIEIVARAKKYEIEQAKGNESVYISLKQIELEKAKLERWDGKWPLYFMGSGVSGLNMLLQAPQMEKK